MNKRTNSPGRVTIPTNLEYIGASAFSSCVLLPLRNLMLPSSLKYIGENAFEYCDAFNGDITIPVNVQIIDTRAFFMSTNVNKVLVENCNTEVRYQAFYGGNYVMQVECRQTRYFSENAFDNGIVNLPVMYLFSSFVLWM